MYNYGVERNAPLFFLGRRKTLSLKSVFQTMKKRGLIKEIDQFLLLKSGEGNDRKNITNSPSSAGKCRRANYYQRQGIAKDAVDPRVQRIFDNGHGMHERIQGYLLEMGILLMDEVPLVNKEWEIQGHTDGFLDMDKRGLEVQILELKSTNSRNFGALRDAMEDHKAQAHVYIFTAEKHRLYLKQKYKTITDFKKSEISRRMKYRKYYTHLEDGSKYTRAEKIKHKVEQHIQMDNILYKLVKPISQAVILYECKDTQNMKEFIIDFNDETMNPVLDDFLANNIAWKTKTLPERSCRSKSDGRFCSYVSHCFE
jgi:hypothetical protein